MGLIYYSCHSLPHRKQQEEPKGEPTTTSDYFSSSRKGRQSQVKEHRASEVQDPKPEVVPNGKSERTTPQAKRNQKIEIRVESPPSIRRGRAKRDAPPIID